MKKQFLIIETTAEHCREYNREVKGRETIRQVEAYSAPEALEEWLADMAETYGITYHKDGFYKDFDPQFIVWEQGDTSADFGDFAVSAEEIVEKGAIHPIFEDIFGSLGAMLNPLTIAPAKEPERHEYSISIQFTTNRKLTPQEADSILDACIIQVQDPYNNEGQKMGVTIVDYKAEIE